MEQPPWWWVAVGDTADRSDVLGGAVVESRGLSVVSSSEGSLNHQPWGEASRGVPLAQRGHGDF